MALPARLGFAAARLSFAAAVIAGIAGIGSAAVGAPANGTILNAGGPSAVPGSYIVVFKDASVTPDQVGASARGLAARYGGKVHRTYTHVLRAVEMDMTEAVASRMAANPTVRYVEQNHAVTATATESPVPSWGLDRIDQRNLPLSNSYTFPNTASNVTAYIIDTGIRVTHQDFGGRARWGTNTTGDGVDTDCFGHGTHVAGTVGGSSFGVAKGVSLVAVKVLDCTGAGTEASVIQGIDWVTADHQAGRPAVANMSLGGGFDQGINDAVTASIADGVTYAVAAGNSAVDACDSSPASTPNAITVGATDITDSRAFFSNTGTCLDIFAPGVNITSAWKDSDTATNTISGTSMATPHVAGVAALILSANPSLTPLQVRDKMVADATSGIVADPGTGSPNKLLVDDAAIAGLSVSNPGGQFGVVGTAISPVNHTASAGRAPFAWSATGLPPGVSINSSTGTVSGTPTTAGTFNATITATDSSSPTRTGRTSYSWSIEAAPVPGCTGTRTRDVQIPDNSTVESALTIVGCSGIASATSTVEVHITHTFPADLGVTLVAPDGTTYLLRPEGLNTGTQNINETYTVNLSSEVANGTWKLRVHDRQAGDTGFIDSWTLTLGSGTTGGGTATPPPSPTPPPSSTPPPSGPPACGGTNDTDVPISDFTTVTSPIVVSGCSGNASATSTVEVHIVHTYIGDLVVSLVAPDGTERVLQDRTGGATDNIDQTYTVNLSSAARNGVWTLRVQDTAFGDTGFINSWTLNLGGTTGGGTGTPPPSPTPPPSSTPPPSGPPACGGTDDIDVPISDFTTVTSPIVVSGCSGNASATSTVEVHIVHTYIGDLVVSLVAPDGSERVLQDRTGGATDNIDHTYTVNLSSVPRNGVWMLKVQDTAFGDTGFINSWTLSL